MANIHEILSYPTGHDPEEFHFVGIVHGFAFVQTKVAQSNTLVVGNHMVHFQLGQSWNFHHCKILGVLCQRALGIVEQVLVRPFGNGVHQASGGDNGTLLHELGRQNLFAIVLNGQCHGVQNGLEQVDNGVWNRIDHIIVVVSVIVFALLVKYIEFVNENVKGFLFLVHQNMQNSVVATSRQIYIVLGKVAQRCQVNAVSFGKLFHLILCKISLQKFTVR
mmetsp:Transcript_26870/g.74045  ORF Transcript_26870/g.74045 Transcript_26870/m.74045 type:complete len:220 (+) Transcript_26870:879-1538(+)